MQTAIQDLLAALVSRPSISPNDAGCMSLISDFLRDTPARIRLIRIEDTDNLFITHGQGAPHICFVGHTDVVPAGNESDWSSPPFTPSIREGKLYGRGSADMKAGVAAMSFAYRELIQSHPQHQGTLSLLLTSDEEAAATHGIQAVLPLLQAEGIHIDYAIVGEPTAKDALGDFARNGRRGSLNLKLQISGKQGHVAYPENICNPIHGLGHIIAEIAAIEWDRGNAHFPPTSCQFSNLIAGTGAENVVPQTATALLNWRFNTEQTEAGIKTRVETLVRRICAEKQLSAAFDWKLSGLPFSTANQKLLQTLSKAVREHCGRDIVFNTAGGTSDARFMAQYGADTVEFGTLNASIHQIDEHVLLADLALMAAVYRDCVRHLWAA